MSTLGILQEMALILLFAFGFILLSEKSYAVTFSRNPAFCRNSLGNMCYEFDDGSYNWEQAKARCENQGGNLLKEMGTLLKLFLQNTKKDTNTTDLSWWLGQGLQGMTEEFGDEETVDITGSCTYLKLNPLHLVNSANCEERRGSLCTYRDLSVSEERNSFKSRHQVHSVVKRDVVDSLDTIEASLRNYEQEIGQPSTTNRSNVITTLVTAVENLPQPIVSETVSRLLNAATGLFLLSRDRCDSQTSPNPPNLFEEFLDLFTKLSLAINADYDQFQLDHPDGKLFQKRLQLDKISNSTLGTADKGHVVLPSLDQFLPPGTEVIAQMMTFKSNPHPTNESINGETCSFALTDAKSKSEIKVKDLANWFEVFLDRPEVTEVTETVLLKKNKLILTDFNITDTNVTVFLTIEPSANVSLRLRLSHNSPPDKNFNGTEHIINYRNGYRWKLTPSMFGGVPGMWYVDGHLHESPWTSNLQLNISLSMVKCVAWDTDIKEWTTDGCQVGDKSTPGLTQCLCNHLTLFGSSFFVMPNHIDLSRTAELFATVSQNYVVLALLCTFFGLYLMTLMWACYADRKASSKRKITLLEDNHPGAQYNYLICVHTGSRSNAGTTASVTMKLIGSECESDSHTLVDPDKPVFERGSVDVFLLATPYPLGELKNMRLQHDNSGGRPAWYVNKVTIQDLQTKQVSVFFCECWLSSDRGDGMTKKTFNAAKTNEIASFRNIFTSRTSNGFRDEHIWVSVWDPPSRSPFTRAQRISCCMSLLLCTMAINIAFWNIPMDKSSPVIISLGIIRLTWQEIMVGIQSGLLMFPINILIITIFRSIKPRIVNKKEEDVEIIKPPAITIPSILKETQEVITMVSQSPRNKIYLSNQLEFSADLGPALDNMHDFIQLMQGETVSDSHWVYCSKFLLCALSHLLLCLEKVDPKNFATTDEYQRILSCTNVLVRKAEMVFTSHLAYCPAPVKVVKRKRTPTCSLPWWCVFIGWFLLFSIAGVSTFFTLLYGFQYGKDKSIKWVVSLGLSLFESIFILQPLKVIGLAVFFALLLKPVSMEETEEVEQVLIAQQDKCRQYTGRDV